MKADALEGLVVLEMCDGIAGPYATKLLADYGARVIKIEPPGGDWTRSYPVADSESKNSESSPLFLYLNTNKESIRLEPSTTQASAILDAVKDADILVEAVGEAGMNALGITESALVKVSPRLARISLSDFGRDGPYASFSSTSLVNSALSGWLNMCGESSREPLQPPGFLSECVIGLNVAVAALAAASYCRGTGSSLAADVSGQEAMHTLLTHRPLIYQTVQELRRREGSLNAIWRCKDGYVGCAFLTGGQWESFIEWVKHEVPAITDPRFADRTGRLAKYAREFKATLEPWFARHTVSELVSEGQVRRIPVAPAPTIPELLAHEQYIAREYFTSVEHGENGRLSYPRGPFRLGDVFPEVIRPAPMLGQHNDLALRDPSRSPASREEQRPPRSKVGASRADVLASEEAHRTSSMPLQGLRVLDLTWVYAGPIATGMLADLGAEVIKIQAPNRPDPNRGLGADPSPGYKALNRNRYGITLNLAHAGGVDLFKQLVRTADVVAENFSTRVMDNFGLGYDVLRRENPGLIMLSMPGFGGSGPWKHFVSHASLTDPASGLAQLTGYRDQEPMLIGYGTCDSIVGLQGAVALLMALHQRANTGHGLHIDVSHAEACTHLIGEEILAYQLTGRVPERRGNSSPAMAPHGVYRCAGEDRWIAIAIKTDAEWMRFSEAIGCAEGAQSRFRELEDRLRHREELDALIEDWTRRQDNFVAMQLLQAAGVSAGAVLNEAEVLNDPNLGFREFFELNPEDGLYYPGHPIRFSGVRPRTRLPAPTTGQHTNEVLQSILGLSTDDLNELRTEGVI